MIDLTEIPEDKLSQTMRGIKREAEVRQWRAAVPYIGSPHCFITRNDGKALHIFSATPPTTSYAAAHLANDKFATYEVLAETDVPQPATLLVESGELTNEAIAFMQAHHRVVAKPLDGGHGKGITVNISTEPLLSTALKEASEAGRSSQHALLQAQYPYDVSYDLRLLCIDFTYCAAILRIPARIFGDGIHTVRKIIEQENASDKRGKAYYAPLAMIDMDKASQYLGEEIEKVPPKGTEVRVLGIANYGAGGETVDVTNAIPKKLIEYAEEASRTCELSVAGVDFLVAQSPEIQSAIDELDPVLIEINKCPLLAMHDAPTSGESQHVIARYMEYLASL